MKKPHPPTPSPQAERGRYFFLCVQPERGRYFFPSLLAQKGRYFFPSLLAQKGRYFFPSSLAKKGRYFFPSSLPGTGRYFFPSSLAESSAVRGFPPLRRLRRRGKGWGHILPKQIFYHLSSISRTILPVTEPVPSK